MFLMCVYNYFVLCLTRVYCKNMVPPFCFSFEFVFLSISTKIICFLYILFVVFLTLLDFFALIMICPRSATTCHIYYYMFMIDQPFLFCRHLIFDHG